MVVIADLIGQGQVGRIEDTCLRAEELEKARGLLDAKAGEGALPERSVEQQNTGWWLIVAKAERGRLDHERPVERRKVIGVGERADAAHTDAFVVSVKRKLAARWAATAPASWAAMKAGTQAMAMPAKLSLNDRAIVIAGLAKLVDAVNQ